MARPLDEERVRRGMRQVYVEGRPEGRHWVIEEAIARLQATPKSALVEGYLGIKNYAHFGDQRFDCSYNMVPRHGHIVFRVGRAGGSTEGRKATTIDADAVYALEAVRDFGSVEHPEDCRRRINLCELFALIVRAEDQLARLRERLSGAEVTSHDGGEE